MSISFRDDFHIQQKSVKTMRILSNSAICVYFRQNTYSQTLVPQTQMDRIPWMARTDLKVRSIFPIFLIKKNLGASNSDGSNTMDGSN